MAGYNWFAGKSNNAVRAEEAEDKVTKSKITAAWLRENGIDETVTFIRFLIKADVIWPDEWHHTSLEEGGHLTIWREMSKIPDLRRADEFTIRQEFLRRLNGQDMFGNTEPTWQKEATPTAEA